MDFKAIKGKYRRYEAKVPVCLDGVALGDLDAAKAELERLLEAGPDSDTATLGGDPELNAAKQRVAELEQICAEATVDFRVRAVPRSVYRMLEAQHPDPEQKLAWAKEGFSKALIQACLVDPVVTDDEFTELLDEMVNGGTFEELFDACWSICNTQQRAPFTRAASVTT